MVKPPPLLISFSNLESLKGALEPEVVSGNWGEIEALFEKKLPPAVSVRVIATMMGVSSKFIGAMVARPDGYYRTFKIKKGKKVREINAPKVALKFVQKWIAYYIQNAVAFDDSVFGFFPGRSAPLAARRHCNARWVYSIDIENFFPSTPKSKIADAMLALGYSNHASRVLSSLCSYKGFLAQGSPASPVISNLIFSPIDAAMSRIALENECVYTRYADDIVFSGKGSPLSDDIKGSIKRLVVDSGWSVAEAKERFVMYPNRLKVHGLLVHNEFPRLTKGYRNRIRALRHLLENGKISIEDMDKVKGHVAYADSIEAIKG